MARKTKQSGAPHREPVEVADGVLRLIAPNPGPFTFHGTNTYMVGSQTLTVIDPGPDDDAHLAAIVAAAGGRPISHIVLTHTHRDHYGLAHRLQAATGAPLVGAGYHSDDLSEAERQFRPDMVIVDGMDIVGPDWHLRAIATPGHASDHLVFELEGADLLFSGDHVMGWSTTVIAPPDGSMSAFMASLRKLLSKPPHGIYLPGHGDPIHGPADYVRNLLQHRLARSASILKRLEQGDRDIPTIVNALYANIVPDLRGAATLTVHAHLLDLIEQARVRSSGQPTLEARYEPC